MYLPFKSLEHFSVLLSTASLTHPRAECRMPGPNDESSLQLAHHPQLTCLAQLRCPGRIHPGKPRTRRYKGLRQGTPSQEQRLRLQKRPRQLANSSRNSRSSRLLRLRHDCYGGKSARRHFQNFSLQKIDSQGAEATVRGISGSSSACHPNQNGILNGRPKGYSVQIMASWVPG